MVAQTQKNITMKKGDLVTINIQQDYSNTAVEFEVIHELPENEFLLLAQDRIVRGRQNVNKLWLLSEPFDAFDLRIIDDKYHPQVSMSHGRILREVVKPLIRLNV